MRKITLICVLVLVAVLSLFVGCGVKSSSAFEGVPQEVEDCVNTYLETWRTEGASASGELAYFMNDEYRAASMASNQELESYTVENYEEINPELYSVEITYVTGWPDDEETDTESAINFVGKIDGEWKFIVNRRSVPEDIRANFDYDKYAISDPNVLD
ncbi:MAG: hypothetical protein LBM18_01425 [Oscillospiraceae bacterium]|jgi:hypothetical protein|nr:hypothetical protein [Oscillospiraceae bacterium]